MVTSDSAIGSLVRQNWALLVAIGVLLGGAGFVYTMENAKTLEPSANVAAFVQHDPTKGVAPIAPMHAVRKTTQQLALEQIAEHEAKIEANPDDEDVPAYLMAMGNLYRQKMLDYESAAECYKRLLYDYEDWEGVRVVYMQLATCYERLNKPFEAKAVYEQMLDVFPADSQEYEIAHAAVFR